MPKKLAMSEQELVNYLQEFFTNNRKIYTEISSNSIPDQINAFLKTKKLTDKDTGILRNALMIQHNACLYARTHYSSTATDQRYYSGSNPSDIILFPIWPYYGGYYGGWGHCHHHHGGSGSAADGDAALVMLAVLAVTSALAATYGLLTDLYEMGTELKNNQRWAANAATVAVTGAAVVGIAVAATAILASNPIGWGIAATSVLVIGLALLVKGVRALNNTIDSALNKKSGLASDSRFQLTAGEETHLRETLGANDEQIEKIKGIIRGLAVQAKNTSQTGFFGSKDKYLEIIKVLNDVKKGDIAPQIKEQYGLQEFAVDRPSNEGGMQAAM